MSYTLSEKAKNTLVKTVRTVKNLPADLTKDKLNRNSSSNSYALKAVIKYVDEQTNLYHINLYENGYSEAPTGSAVAEIIGISYIGVVPEGTKVLVFPNSVQYTGDSI